jgi:transposase-like protein
MFKGRHFDQSVILPCVRWYLTYKLSLRDLEEMMAERALIVDHSTVHRWVVRFSPELPKRFNRRKRAVTGKWHLDENYIKVWQVDVPLSRHRQCGRDGRVLVQPKP